MANDVRIRAWVKDEVTGPLGKITDKFDNLGKSKGFQSIAMGVGVGIGAQLWSQASGQIVSAIGDAVEAAKEEEVSIQKLGSALKANVENYNGNTDAIERVLAARMKLGFSDDEQRDSLAKLVAATHDVNKALEIQRTAMDLARFKGISLADATDALTKVEAGSFRILKSLGITLKDNATQTEALAAVQRVASGQAEDYANTNTGKLLVAQVKVGEAMEKFGTSILPLVADATSAAADAITGLSDAYGLLSGQMPATTQAVEETAVALLDLGSKLPFVGSTFKAFGDVAEANMTKVAATTETATGKAADDLDIATGKTDELGDHLGDLADTADTETRSTAGSFESMTERIVDSTNQLIDDAFDPIEERLEVQGQHMETLADIQKRESAKGRKAIHDANSDIIDDLDDQAKNLTKLGKRHKLTARDVDQYEADVKKAYKAMGKNIPPEIQKVIAKLRTLSGFDGKSTTYTVRIATGGKGAHKGRAIGGPVSAHETYLVGEKGPELFTSDKSGTIIPNDKLPKTSGGMHVAAAGGQFAITVNVVSAGVLSPSQGQSIAREVGPYLRDYLNRRG